MEQTSGGYVLFYTCLMLPMKNGTKSVMAKIDPGAEVNTIPLSRYQKLFPHKITKSRYPNPGTLIPTSNSWISHDGKAQPFLGHIIANGNHAILPVIPLCHFYVFEDATSPKILLSFMISEWLGNLEFKVPNLVAQLHIDTLTVPTSPNSGSLRKTAQNVTFWDPLINLDHAALHAALPTTAA